MVQEIRLNSIGLNITKVKFWQNHLHLFLDGTVQYDEEYEQARIQFNQSLNVSREIGLVGSSRWDVLAGLRSAILSIRWEN